MANISSEAKWYIAEIVQEIVVADDPRNVVHKNLMLIQASSPDEAYEKAIQLGKESEDSYENPSGKQVRFKFRGLGALNVIEDDLIDGAELLYEQRIGVSEQEIEKCVLPKDLLGVFQPIGRGDWPDYSSKEVMDDVKRLIGDS